MGCLLSLFRHGTLTPPKGQLTDKLLEGAVTEELQAEPADQKNGAQRLNGDPLTTEGDKLQGEAPDEPFDDDKALLLGALGATAAGAVTVGAVAGALKTAQDRGEPQEHDQDRDKLYQTVQDQKESLTGLSEDREETLKTTQDQKETLSTVQDPSEPPNTAQDRIESPTASPGRASLKASDEPPGNRSAAATAATIIGTGGAATAAALTRAALQSDQDATAAGETGDLPQRRDSEIEEEHRESAKSEDEAADLLTEGRIEEASETPTPQEKREDDTPTISGSEHSEVLKSSKAPQSPSGSVEALSSGSRDHTPLQHEPAVSASPDDSVFNSKQLHSQSGTPTERQESPAERQESPALVTDADDNALAEPEVRPKSGASERESLSERLPEPPIASPHSDKEDDLTRTSSRVMESPLQTVTEQEDSRIQSAEQEFVAPPDEEDVVTESPVVAVSDQSRVDNEAKESEAPIMAADESLAKLESIEDSRVRSPAGVDDKEVSTTAAGDKHHVGSPTEWESLIQSADVDVQAPAAEDDSHIPSSATVEELGDQLTIAEEGSHVLSSASQESAQPLAKEESDVPSTTTEEVPGIEPSSVRGEDRSKSPETAKDETPASTHEGDIHAESATETEHQSQLSAEDSHVPSPDPTQLGSITERSNVDSVAQSSRGEKGGQPLASDTVSMSTSAGMREPESPKENLAREEVDTPKIVPEKTQSQKLTPEYEKFMSILVSPKGERQASVEQAGVEDSNEQMENAEQGQTPSQMYSGAKPEKPSSIPQKHEEEAESRAESSAEAVCGSATDLQEKINSVQSPVPSVKEEPVVKVDRFSVDTDAGSASAGSGKGGVPGEVNADAASSPSVVQSDNNVDDPQLDLVSHYSTVDPQHNIAEKDLESDPGNETNNSRDVPSGAGPLKDVLEQNASPDAVPDKSESTHDAQAGLGVIENAGLGDPLASAEPAEETDMAQDVSDRTEDYDFDPLARTQSFIFPDELAGRSSQLSEKPSSPFPDLDENDIRGTSVTPSSNDIKQAVEESDKATQEINIAALEETRSTAEPNMTALGTEKPTSLKEEVEPEGVITTPVDTTSEADNRDGDSLSEKVKQIEEAVTSEAEKSADKIEKETAESPLTAQRSEDVNTEEAVPETTVSPSQPAVAEETDALGKNSEDTDQPPSEVNQAATKIQAGVRGWQTRRKISRQQEAATQIQAGFRGWRVRRGQRMRRTSSLPELSNAAPSTSDDQYMDVDTLKDRAAAKIQAGFRGWRTRQEMKTLAADSPLEDSRVSPANSMAEISSEEQAAARIQAGYRGWKTRRTLRRSLSDPNSEALVLAESQQQKRVAETGAGASGQPAAVDDLLLSSVEAATPRDEDETAHSIQSIQSEIASGGETPRHDDNAPTITPPTTEPIPAAQPIGEPSKVDPSASDSSTVELSADSPFVGDASEADTSTADPSAAPLSSADQDQQAEAAAKIQAGYRGWKTRQQMRADTTDADAETAAVRPTVSAKSVTDSGALPIDFAIVHRPEDDWLTQDLMKIEAEKRADGKETAPGPKTDEKLVASASDEPDGKDGKDARPDSASTTESSSSWLTHAQTEIRASFQGLRDNVSDALKTVEDTARLVREKGAGADAEGGAEGGAVVVTESTHTVTESGAGAPQPASESEQGSSNQLKEALAPLKPVGQTGMDVTDADRSEKSPSEREEEEIWEEIQRSMRHED